MRLNRQPLGIPARPPLLQRPRLLRQAAALAVLGLSAAAVSAADTDIYASGSTSGAPNILFFLDNTANWSNQAQSWVPKDSWDKCKTLGSTEQTLCKAAIEEVFYVGRSAADRRPWELLHSYSNPPTQGQVELRAIRFVLKQLVCSGTDQDLKVNVGLSMFSPDKGSASGNGDASAFIYQAVKPLTSGSGSTCEAMLAKLDAIDKNINSPTTKAPQDADYGAALYEAFKYFGGYTSPDLAGKVPAQAGSPVGATGYGPRRFSVKQALDDSAAFSDAGTTYKSPLSGNGSCGSNYLVLVGNTYPKAENAGPTSFNGLNYLPPSLSALTSDTSRYADEWAYFLANTDIHEGEGVQRLFTYAVNVYNIKADPAQGRLLRSMAAAGGVGAAGYVEVGGDLLKLVTAFSDIFVNIAAVNSVFAATTLPVSTTTQGTYLNQIFVGMFRPDANGKPRWVGNLKQYQLGRNDFGSLDLFDANNKPAVLASSGFISPLAQSFWTQSSVFFNEQPSGTPASASDGPDGAIVEKGGVAQQLRRVYERDASARQVFTVPGDRVAGSFERFETTLLGSLLGQNVLDADTLNWARGENNVAPSSPGAEDFVGSYRDGSTVKLLGSTGARHAIHGDVLHSRPVALNYGGNRVVVYYGSNDGFLRAVDGRQTGSTAGPELWSFVAPEHLPLLKRHRAGSPLLQLPETDSSGAMLAPDGNEAPKSYGIDGPIGVFALYADKAVKEAIIYPTMRRGGRSVYAIDVSKAGEKPSLKWKITGGSGDFAKLGQTWSMPKPVIVSSALSSDPYLIMGGGYDPLEDKNQSQGWGNVVYVLNARTGALLKTLPTERAVPGDVTLVDANLDGVIDRAYVGDLGGNVYRIDLSKGDGTVVKASEWTIKKIATLPGKIFSAPDVVATKRFVAVLVGTGDREKPLLVSTSEQFALVKDTLPGSSEERSAALTLSDLALVGRVSSRTDTEWELLDANPNANSNNGCYLALATNGEKIVNTPFTIAGATYFGTNRPSSGSPNSCSADLGVARTYKFPLFCGAPSSNLLVGGGLPPSPVGGLVTIKDPDTGKEELVPFLIGSGKDGSSFAPDEPKPPIAPVRTRQNWRIDNTNR